MDGLFNASLFTGFGIDPLMGGLLTDHFGMNAAFSTMSGFNFLAFLLVLIALPETRQRKSILEIRPSFRTISKSNIIRGLIFYRLSYSLSRGAYSAFIPIYGTLYIGISPSQVGILLTTHTLLMSIIQTYTGNLADRLNRRFLIIAGGIVSLAFIALIPFANSFQQLLILCIIGSLGGGTALPSTSAMMVEQGRVYGMGSTMGLQSMALSIGMGFGPLMGGFINDIWSISSVFHVGAMIMFFGIIVFALFTRKS